MAFQKIELTQLYSFLLWFTVYAITYCSSESSTCLMVYKEGGAPAVFQSPKCPLWKLSDYTFQSPNAPHCQIAMHQGRRKYQEDRTLCALDIRIPFPSKTGIMEVPVGIIAVFDGHNGAEASEMASKILLEYFVVHTYFLLDATYSGIFKRPINSFSNEKEHGTKFDQFIWNVEISNRDRELGRRKYLLPADFVDDYHLEILKEALLRAIQDIDKTFSKEAHKNNLVSGSTATVILLADAQILVANIGDSKTFLCSEKFQSPAEAKATFLRLYKQKRYSGASRARGYGNSKPDSFDGLTHFFAKELTRDHHPDREDERSRVEIAGGHVVDWGGVPRVNGQLAISRAIGDVSFKSYGVISAPEVTDWQPLSTNDSYLVVSSDGIFEKLSSQDVCDLLWEIHNDRMSISEYSPSCSYSLAECIVSTAFERGSMDNMAAIVVPLRSAISSQRFQEGRFVVQRDSSFPISGIEKLIKEHSANSFSSNAVQLEHSHPVMSKFKRLLVEGRHNKLGCFYLSENLDEYKDYVLRTQTDEEEYLCDLPHALPESLNQPYGGSLNVYNDQSLCFHLGAKDQCFHPEGFASFIGLLESIPFHDPGSDYQLFEHPPPILRYVLKKRFGQGSYGEVWLAFHGNCQEAFTPVGENIYDSCNSSFGDANARNGRYSSNSSQAYALEDNVFIMKRVMVERGAGVYLSGLREKYFGEIFFNASTRLEDVLSTGTSNFVFEKSPWGSKDLLVKDESLSYKLGETRQFKNAFPNQFGPKSVMYEEGLNHIVRFVESFESRSNEIWLVFHYEGISLSKLIYSIEDADEEKVEQKNHVQILQPSKWWHWLKTTEAGQEEMKSLIRQLLMALKSCHDRNITHRDIKPENMVICFEDQATGKCLNGSRRGDENFSTKMRIIDFGSAIDEFTVKHLYGSAGPSRVEQTYDYTPPEALLNSSWYQEMSSATLKYDMWSVGVVMLELILGSPNVFQVGDLTRVLLDQHLEGWNEGLKQLAYKLRSFMELCILIPGSPSKSYKKNVHQGGSPASWKCSEEVFAHQIKSRDPLKLGFPNVWALRLVRNLLQWNPEDRLNVDDALRHPYFHPFS
ncbi:uncharacterized protein LOC111491615 isoform X1 [Cucurbita maxima]|uniref:Uncharacterized protein LOC111491615 isoform X1 n=2 Tax=Cucurbita maxima TaxID=3661 RepID=A0A6J1K8H8_CUCMA|nr:uncharacterized protein LOC111491615 isoform X1 [Cucurbita maxima]